MTLSVIRGYFHLSQILQLLRWYHPLITTAWKEHFIARWFKEITRKHFFASICMSHARGSISDYMICFWACITLLKINNSSLWPSDVDYIIYKFLLILTPGITRYGLPNRFQIQNRSLKFLNSRIPNEDSTLFLFVL